MGGALDSYDDMAGLEFGDLDELFNMTMAKEMAIAGGAGAAAILLTVVGTQKLASLDYFKNMDPKMRSRVMSGASIVAGVAAGRGLYHYNRDAGMGVVGGLVGLGVANLIGSLLDVNPLGAPLGQLAEDGDNSMLSAYDYAAMQGLSEAQVDASAPAFAGLMGPTVSMETLSGFQGAVVQQETLGAYMPYLT